MWWVAFILRIAKKQRWRALQLAHAGLFKSLWVRHNPMRAMLRLISSRLTSYYRMARLPRDIPQLACIFQPDCGITSFKVSITKNDGKLLARNKTSLQSLYRGIFTACLLHHSPLLFACICNSILNMWLTLNSRPLLLNLGSHVWHKPLQSEEIYLRVLVCNLLITYLTAKSTAFYTLSEILLRIKRAKWRNPAQGTIQLMINRSS